LRNEIGRIVRGETKLSQICRDVAATGQAVVVTHRWKPIVRIEKESGTPKQASVWDRRAAHVKKNGPFAEDFDLPKRARQTWRDPLA
jgi:antitoxin (DNA-binding transcriptional repressor) of toxin-antitoxin stability system